jgi:hypothetical protein
MELVTLSTGLLIAIALIVFGAATVKGVAGLGFPLITVPLVANLVGPHAAVVMIAVPTVASNLFMVAQGGGTVARLRQMAWLIVGLAAGAAVSARLLRDIDPGMLALVLGVIAVGYAGPELARVPLRLSSSPRAAVSLGVGAVAGLLGGSTTIYAPLVAAYVDSLRLAKNEFVFWVTALFLLGTSIQVVTYLQAGIYRGGLLQTALLLCLPMLIGTWLGIRLRDRLAAHRFRTLVLVLVLLSGLNLIVRALWR